MNAGLNEPLDQHGMLLLCMLAHVSRRKPDPWYRIDELLRTFDTTLNRFGLLPKVLTALEENWFILCMDVGNDIAQTSVRITAQGYLFIDMHLGGDCDAILRQSDLELPRRIVGEFPNPLAVSSASWTGRRTGRDLRSAATYETLTKHLRGLETEIEGSDLSNLEKSKALSLCRAMFSLVDSPEPDLGAILMILRSPVFATSVSLLGIVVTLASIVAAL